MGMPTVLTKEDRTKVLDYCAKASQEGRKPSAEEAMKEFLALHPEFKERLFPTGAQKSKQSARKPLTFAERQIKHYAKEVRSMYHHYHGAIYRRINGMSTVVSIAMEDDILQNARGVLPEISGNIRKLDKIVFGREFTLDTVDRIDGFVDLMEEQYERVYSDLVNSTDNAVNENIHGARLLGTSCRAIAVAAATASTGGAAAVITGGLVAGGIDGLSTLNERGQVDGKVVEKTADGVLSGMVGGLARTSGSPEASLNAVIRTTLAQGLTLERESRKVGSTATRRKPGTRKGPSLKRAAPKRKGKEAQTR